MLGGPTHDSPFLGGFRVLEHFVRYETEPGDVLSSVNAKGGIRAHFGGYMARSQMSYVKL